MPDYRDQYRGKTVLVTGGAGSIGSNLCKALAALGARVLALDDLSSSQRWNLPSDPSLAFIEGDILDDAKMEAVFQSKPRLVFHLAAFFANQNSIERPERDLMVNGMGTLRLLNRSVSAKVERFVFASSSSVYGADLPLPLREESRSTAFETPYQITKVLGELYCNFFHSHHHLDLVVPRFFNSYGPGEAPGRYRNVVPNFIYRAMLGMPLPITGTGQETRDFTYVGDIVDGLLRLGHYPGVSGQEFNLGSGRETRIGDLAATINRLTGNHAGIQRLPRRGWDTKSRRWADISKAQRLIGYSPSTSLEDGLNATVQWFRENWDHIRSAVATAEEAPAAARRLAPDKG